MRGIMLAGVALGALWGTAPAVAQSTADEQFFACVTPELAGEFRDLILSRDTDAATKFWINKAVAGACHLFEKGDTYYFRSTGWREGCYRPAGKTECFVRIYLPTKKAGG